MMAKLKSANRALKTRSRFARVLQSLLDDTSVFNRDEWAEVLGVSTAALSQWVHDKTVPRPEMLRSLSEVVQRHCGDAHAAMQAFHALLTSPAIDVSPHGHRLGPTVGHYLVAPLLDGFQRVLATISPAQQELILQRASAECRRIRDGLEDRHGASATAQQVTPKEESAPTSYDVSKNDEARQIAEPSDSSAVVGRLRELDAIRQFLNHDRLVLVSGQVGVGKTFLATAAFRTFLGKRAFETLMRIDCRSDQRRNLLWAPLLCASQDSSVDDDGPYFFADGNQRRRSMLVLLDDLDEIRSDEISRAARYVSKLSSKWHMKVILTCRDTSYDIIKRQIRDHFSWTKIADVQVPLLSNVEMQQLWTAKVNDIGLESELACSQRLAWLSSGSPGFCSDMVRALKEVDIGTRVITEEHLRPVAKAVLNSDMATSVGERLARLSTQAKAFVFLCALSNSSLRVHDHQTRLAMSNLLAITRLLNTMDTRKAAKEAAASEYPFLEEMADDGFRLREDFVRPYLRSIVWAEVDQQLNLD
jgi:hypothetical protein